MARTSIRRWAGAVLGRCRFALETRAEIYELSGRRAHVNAVAQEMAAYSTVSTQYWVAPHLVYEWVLARRSSVID